MLPVPTEIIHSHYKNCGFKLGTDTRNIVPGSVFFCLKGQNFNGNLFAHEALSKGAAYVVADQADVCTDPRIFYVEDTLIALQQLANYHRHTLATHILAIGGSNGKTTTKELCAAVLGSAFKIKATRGNLNNHIGVPLTLLELDGSEKIAIVEMGTNHPGEMKILCDIAEANSGIVTNVGKEHLEGFGSIEAVAREESELYLSLLQNKGQALVNADDTWLGNMAGRLENKFSYSIHNPADLQGMVHHNMPKLKFSLLYKEQTYGPYTAKLGGSFNLYNILAAISAGIQNGINIDDAAKAACTYQPGNNRSEWKIVKGKQVLLDAYNANPSSVELALKEFATIQGTKCVCLGDMLELGSYAEKEHQAIFELAKELGFEKIYLSGPEFRKASNYRSYAFENTEALVHHLQMNPISQDHILIKGSRGMKMEMVLDAL